MTYQRNDVVLVPIPYTNLQQSKVRPAIVLSGTDYHATEPDLILGAITTNLATTTTLVDYRLVDWDAANLRFPSAFKPILFTLEPSLILYRIGRLTSRDADQISIRVRYALSLAGEPLKDLLSLPDLTRFPASQVQLLAEKAVKAVVELSASQANVHPHRLLDLLTTS